MKKNSCNFIGWLVDNPREFEDKNGMTRTTFTLSVERNNAWKYGGRDTDYFDFIAWGELAKHIAKKYEKGDLLAVIDARAKVREIRDQNGKNKRKIEFVVNRVNNCRWEKSKSEGQHDEEFYIPGDI